MTWKLTFRAKGETINLSCGKGDYTSCSLPPAFQLTREGLGDPWFLLFLPFPAVS